MNHFKELFDFKQAEVEDEFLSTVLFVRNHSNIHNLVALHQKLCEEVGILLKNTDPEGKLAPMYEKLKKMELCSSFKQWKLIAVEFEAQLRKYNFKTLS